MFTDSDRALSRAEKITKPQLKHLEQLLIDTGFGDRTQRNGYLSRITDRDIRFIDELTKVEASKAIGELKAKRDERNEEWRQKKLWEEEESE